MTRHTRWMTWIVEDAVEAAFVQMPWHRETRTMRRVLRLRLGQQQTLPRAA
jgi:hypothetical protein